MLRRLKLEVLMGGGKLSNGVAFATHLVVLMVPGIDVDLDFLLRRYGDSIHLFTFSTSLDEQL